MLPPELPPAAPTRYTPPGQAASPGCIMKSVNFEFLRARRAAIADLGAFAERYAHSDPSSSLVKARALLEQVVECIYVDQRLPRPDRAGLHDLLLNEMFELLVPRVVREKMHAVRVRGNKAAHGEPVPPAIVVPLLQHVYDIAVWFHITVDGGRPDAVTRFVPPPVVPADEQSKGEIKREKRELATELARQESLLQQALAALEAERATHAAEVRAARDELTELKTAGERVAATLKFSEAETRRFLIDTALVDAGWNVGPKGASTEQVGQEVLLHGIPNNVTGDGYADYVLWGADGLPLAVVEAKKAAKSNEEGRTQAWSYAEALERKYGRRPVAFYTNGIDIHIWDHHPSVGGLTAVPRKIYGFYSKDSLEYLHFQHANRDALDQVAPNPGIAGRLYQLEAIKRVTERFSDGHRKVLIAQATGTGKTRVAVSLCDVLTRAKWAKRILFLCDRRELRKQADGVFKEHLPGEPRVMVSSSTSSDRDKRIYLATYPAMMQCYETFDVGFFDLIIADESHRSIYNKYRDLFKYFDAFQVGLTATPRNLVDFNTYDLFGCADKDPTFYYSLKDAVEGTPQYLVPYRVVKVTTKFQREGIRYSQMTDEQKQQLEQQAADATSFDYESSKLDRDLFNKDTTRSILRNLMENGIRDAHGSLPGKSIIFARNHKHAVHMAEVFAELYPKYGGQFCRVVDNYDPKAEQLIDDFKTANGPLRIAISVDMLDTGIDVPEVVNLVFAKPIRSYVKFWQMIGRGTRLCANLFGPGRDKSEFLIFDHWGNFDYFDEEYNEVQPPREESLMEQVLVARVELAAAALQAMEQGVFDFAIALIAADIRTLQTSRAIDVRDQWRALQELGSMAVLQGFSAKTKHGLVTIVGPLMRWADIRDEEDAYRCDLLVAQLQTALLEQSGRFSDLKGALVAEVDALQKNLNPVKAKAETIKRVRSAEFWASVTASDIEAARLDLRSIMKYKFRISQPGLDPRLIDVTDGDEIRKVHVPSYEGQELIAYRQRVEGVLRSHFMDDPILARIREGAAVPEADLEALARMVLHIDPQVDLRHLPVHINTKGDLHRALRSVVGMEPDAVEPVFAAFIHKHAGLTAHQQRFVGMLKAHICANGGLEVERLYQAPFTALDPNGIDGIFNDDEALISELLDLVSQFNHPHTARRAQ